MKEKKSKRISFYSFKGGSGRSSATANIAYYLAMTGSNVGCIDFDIESAGLNYIFDIPIGFLEKDKKGRYLQHYLNPANKDSDKNFENHIVDVGEAKGYDLKGKLYLLPSATDAVLTADVPDEIKLFPIVNRLLDKFETYYDLDYLFLDSRSGVSNFALPALIYADVLTVFFRWGRQHRDGTFAMVPWIKNFLRGFKPNIRLCLVASNIPETITGKEIKEYVNSIKNVHIEAWSSIYETEILKISEQIMIEYDKDSKTAKEYISLAEILRDL